MPIPQTKNLPEKPSFKWSYGFLVLVAAVVAAVILRVWQWVSPGHPVPLLAPAEGLVQAASVPEAEQVVAHEIPMPSDLAGSDVAVVGVYTKAAENIAAGSVAIELKRNDWRFAEIFEQPVALDTELARWNLLPHEPIVLSPSVQGQLFDLGRRYTQCIGGTDTDPGVCQLTHLLIFPLGDLTVTLGADDTHASDGELITLAKSMLPPDVTSTQP